MSYKVSRARDTFREVTSATKKSNLYFPDYQLYIAKMLCNKPTTLLQITQFCCKP